jgi:hypothetical protein
MITRYLCQITECGWYHNQPDPEMTAVDWRGSISASVSAVMEREYMDADRIIGAHLAVHTPLQWATEVNAWRTLAAQVQRAVTAYAEAVQGAPDPDDATRCFREFMGSVQVHIDHIRVRLVADSGIIQEAG